VVRLFVALEIPAAVRDHLAAVIAELREVDSAPSRNRAKWVPPENLHVTLKFIGQIEDAKLDAIRAALTAVGSGSAVDVSFRGLGFFPNEKRPRVFWAGMKASANLAVLAGDIDKRLEPLGVPRETREFTPHLTLARFDPPGISDKLRAAIQKAAGAQPLGLPSGQTGVAEPQEPKAAREFGALHTTEYHLIESRLHRSRAEYTTLQSFRFAAEG
jgi:RNA 2',3'-cyclic 3'-phosphodiesterase